MYIKLAYDEKKLVLYGIIAIVLLTAASLVTNPQVSGFFANLNLQTTGFATATSTNSASSVPKLVPASGTTASTASIILQPDGSSTVLITFNGDPFAEGSNNPINGFLTLVGQKTPEYSSIDDLQNNDLLADYDLIGVNLDENTYTYALILRPGLDSEKAVEDFSSDPNVFSIG